MFFFFFLYFFFFFFGLFFFFQAEDGIRDIGVTGVQTCALPISGNQCIPIQGQETRIYSIREPEYNKASGNQGI